LFRKDDGFGLSFQQRLRIIRLVARPPRSLARRYIKMQFDKDYLVATAERAVKTFFQVLLAVVGTDALGALSADWKQALAVAGMSAGLSVLTSLAGANFGSAGPSLVGETTKPETVVVEKIVEVPVAAKAAAKKAPAKKTTAAKKKTA
jgi:hypothetical protein